MKEPFLYIHHFEPSSRANGPGLRAVLWVQGCSLGCPGCFNPETHSRPKAGAQPGTPSIVGEYWPVSFIMDKILAEQSRIEGVTISGGEPLQQRPALEILLNRIRHETSLSVLLFSGYTWLEIQKMRRIERLLPAIDVLLAGRYDESQRIAAGLTGSANKTIHFLSNRYSSADLRPVPVAEVILTELGEIHLTGINPLHW
ncbi:MAG: 4Fe-4S single cluster domain-containing protein [Anaerolineaceae bacterium]|nr:4Fe-4S single cluster domain-containing protein [Anaerolineaceae bacterium]